MARIQPYRQQITPGSLPSVSQNITPRDMTGINKTIAKGLDLVNEYYVRVNETKVASLDNITVQKFNEHKNNYLQMSQEAAHAGYKDYESGLDIIVSEVEAMAENDQQRQMLSGLLEKRKTQMIEAGSRHASIELRKWQDAESDTRSSLAVDDAIRNRRSPNLIKQSMNTMAIEQWNKAKRAGLHDDIATELVKDQKSEAHIQIINAFLGDQDYETANEYFREHSDQIRAKEHPDLLNSLNKFSTLGKSQTEADRIWALHKDDPKAAQEAARKIDDPEVRRQTESLVQSYISQDENMRKLRDRGLMDQAANVYFQGGTLENFSPGMIAALGPDKVEAYRKLMVNREKMGIGDNWQTSHADTLAIMADSTANPEAMQNFVETYDFTKYMHLNFDDQEQLYKHKESLDKALKSGGTLGSKQYMIRTTKSVVDDLLVEKLGKKSKWNDTDKETANRFHVKLQDFVNQNGFEKDTPEVLEKVSKAAAAMLLRDKDLFGDSEGYLFDLNPTQLLDDPEDFTEELSNEDRRALRQRLIDGGLEPTDKNILELYLIDAGLIK